MHGEPKVIPLGFTGSLPQHIDEERHESQEASPKDEVLSVVTEDGATVALDGLIDKVETALGREFVVLFHIH